MDSDQISVFRCSLSQCFVALYLSVSLLSISVFRCSLSQCFVALYLSVSLNLQVFFFLLLSHFIVFFICQCRLSLFFNRFFPVVSNSQYTYHMLLMKMFIQTQALYRE
jgi:hypothetical protein